MDQRKVAAMEIQGVPGQVSRDRRLVELAGAGDAAAYAELIEGRLVRLLRTATAIIGNAADAHDATQEALVSAWAHLPQLRDPDRFDAWLGRTLQNSCRQTLRRRQRSVPLDDDPGGSVPDHARASLESASIRSAFGRLSVDDRHILLLHHLHHMPLTEVARQLNVPVGTAKSRLWRARKALERALEAER